MLYLIAIILLIGWVLGFFVFSAGYLIHVLLVIAIIAILLRLIRGDRASDRFEAMNKKYLKEFLDRKVDEYNQPFFIKNDPISIPHLFTKKQDIEIAGFFAAIFSWGNRTTIIRKSKELMELMKMAPYEFCLNAGRDDLKTLTGFKHRTFNATDLLYFIEFLQTSL